MPDHAPTPSPSPFGREQQLLTVREFELYRESENKLGDQRELRINQARQCMEQLVEAKMLAAESKAEARFTSNDRALAIATLETKQHLLALNGEQSRLAQDRERFISREYYEGVQKEFSQWRDQVNAALSIGHGRGQGIGLSWGVVLGLIGALVSIGSIILALSNR